ncbi:hypothetical protein Ae505Ps2_4397c [Pseudonocardia sp. Ae505_Ps2]|nr:hypothetical protein Ae505Ps2_4397c [Pseudonocardia sp. Ae505_Ps2]
MRQSVRPGPAQRERLLPGLQVPDRVRPRGDRRLDRHALPGLDRAALEHRPVGRGTGEPRHDEPAGGEQPAQHREQVLATGRPTTEPVGRSRLGARTVGCAHRSSWGRSRVGVPTTAGEEAITETYPRYRAVTSRRDGDHAPGRRTVRSRTRAVDRPSVRRRAHRPPVRRALLATRRHGTLPRNRDIRTGVCPVVTRVGDLWRGRWACPGPSGSVAVAVCW